MEHFMSSHAATTLDSAALAPSDPTGWQSVQPPQDGKACCPHRMAKRAAPTGWQSVLPTQDGK
eukprot:1152704-Pelagomonas_calceolata.AAC.3